MKKMLRWDLFFLLKCLKKQRAIAEQLLYATSFVINCADYTYMSINIPVVSCQTYCVYTLYSQIIRRIVPENKEVIIIKCLGLWSPAPPSSVQSLCTHTHSSHQHKAASFYLSSVALPLAPPNLHSNLVGRLLLLLLSVSSYFLCFCPLLRLPS